MHGSFGSTRRWSAIRAALFVPLVALGIACGHAGPGNDGAAGDGSGGDGSAIDGSSDGGGLDAQGDGAPSDMPTGDSVTPFDAPPADGPVVVDDAGHVVTDPDGGTWVCHTITCQMHQLECGDCIDNDGDGLIDEHDPECLGPCGNSEGPTLYPDVGGGTAAACHMNCYFNYGIGSGSDGCEWSHTCDPHEVPPNNWPQAGCPYNPSDLGGRTCPNSQTDMCLNTCMPLTPNGCDCFGCCTFPQIAGRNVAEGGEWVYLGSRDSAGTPSCTFDGVTDVNRCHPCQPVENCLNGCGPCEVCIGRPMPDPSCFMTPSDGGVTTTDGSTGVDVPPGTDVPITPTDGGMTGSQCPAGVQPCGLPGQAACPFGYYCITGCCEAAPG
jgi:hypothetical protein